METITILEELKLTGLPQSLKFIFTWKAIFAQITLTMILPVALIMITAHTNSFLDQIKNNPSQVFKIGFTCFVREPFGSTGIFSLHLSETIASSNTNRDNVNYHKGVRNTLLLMYFLTSLGYNLMLAVSRLGFVVAYAIVVGWCIILTTYHLGLIYMLFVWKHAILGISWSRLKARVRGANLYIMYRLMRMEKFKVKTKMVSILIGILNNLHLMYPLMLMMIMNVGEGWAPIRTMVVVLLVFMFLLPMFIPAKLLYLISKSRNFG